MDEAQDTSTQTGSAAASAKPSRVARLRALYEGSTPRAHRFRYGLLVFDIVTILFVVGSSFIPHTTAITVVDTIFGVLILTDFLIRLRLDHDRMAFFMRPATWADLISMVSFLAPIAGEGLAFLRILRTLRLLHTYQMLARLRQDFPYFRRNEEIIFAAINLSVFLFIMTGLIYALQNEANEQIGNYADALYFTVTTLTTTGFGDITLQGTSGRLLSVGVMIVGVTLFLRLAQVLFRPSKVRKECPHCGLLVHDADAVHCKHCGETIHISTEGRF
ncbi:voltage-gated potassium channel [Cribrihabitans marinus]|uniref:Voltage-gated potassium channel n=1 Tax=Cribrihabitans marinus TaxID=1227549 RepID=A0A1H7ANL7_9RHOB|nr:zinc ribbon domain-containing protein [Cribrihabitans marinus]GGH32134.1 ion transporter [Cribrihabitans marinus]SEJ66928.1 voltage-gated potassium channel [Cribrihabitans marinus]